VTTALFVLSAYGTGEAIGDRIKRATDARSEALAEADAAKERALADLKATNVASSRAVWAEFAKLSQPQSQAMLDEVYLATHKALGEEALAQYRRFQAPIWKKRAVAHGDRFEIIELDANSAAKCTSSFSALTPEERKWLTGLGFVKAQCGWSIWSL
jgi:hypothetical protein